MNKEFLYMQKLAGIITESEYNSKLNENKFEMVGSDVDELLDAVSLVNGKNIAKLKPLDTTGHQIADDKFSIEVELDNSEFIQKINSFLEENGFQIKLYETNENKFKMVGSDVDELLDAVSLVNGKNIAKLKPLDTTGHQIADDKFSIEVELDNSEFIQKINSFLEENGFQIKLYETK